MKIYLVILIAAGATIGLVQRNEIVEARDVLENSTHTASGRTEIKSAQGPADNLTPDQIARMRADRLELMRLRASIGDLRAAAQSPERTEAEIANLEKAAQAEETKAKLFEETQRAEQLSTGIKATLRILGAMIQVATQANGGKVVRSSEALERGARASGRFPNFEELWQGLTQGKPDFGISLNDFEFVPEEATRNGILIMRERQPRQLPDGHWARLYLTADFQVNEKRLKTPDFSQWEKEVF